MALKINKNRERNLLSFSSKVPLIKNFSVPQTKPPTCGEQSRAIRFCPQNSIRNDRQPASPEAGRSEATSSGLSGLPFSKVSSWQESNLHRLLRREIFYPLNYKRIHWCGGVRISVEPWRRGSEEARLGSVRL